MPHYRARSVVAKIKKALTFSPVVGLLGQRQVGKTTLLTQFAKSYESLDLRTALDQAEIDSTAFVSNRIEPFGIDECQLSPALFPALKESVRINQRPGRYILTGSVRFLSKSNIRESLTGRIVNVEILPLSMAENHGDPLVSIVKLLMENSFESTLERHASSSATPKDFSAFDSYLERGGLPGICFFHDSSIRKQKFEAQLETLIERDFRLIKPTTLGFRQLILLLRTLAAHEGQPLDLALLARETRISTITLKSLLLALEALFLIRRIGSVGGRKKDIVFFEDVGMSSYLVGPRNQNLIDLTRGLYASLRVEAFSEIADTNWEIFQFRTPKGAIVPLCFKRGQQVLGIIPSLEENPVSADIFSASRFLQAIPNSKIVYATTARQSKILNTKQAIIPYPRLLRPNQWGKK